MLENFKKSQFFVRKIPVVVIALSIIISLMQPTISSKNIAKASENEEKTVLKDKANTKQELPVKNKNDSEVALKDEVKRIKKELKANSKFLGSSETIAENSNQNLLSTSFEKLALETRDKPSEAKYRVTYKFEGGFPTWSGDITPQELPEEVMDVIEEIKDDKEYSDKEIVKAIMPSELEITIPGYGADMIWRFAGYDKNEKQVNGQDITFVGKWREYISPHDGGKESGSVLVRYVDENNQKLQRSRYDMWKEPVGTPYNTAENETEKPSEITKNGVTYKYLKTIGQEVGTVQAGVTTVTYVYKADKYKVKYEFKSSDPKKEIPEEVLKQLPKDDEEYVDGTTVKAKQPTKKELIANDGIVWKFKGYDKDEETIKGGDITFVGTLEPEEIIVPLDPNNPPKVKRGSVVVHYLSTDNKKLKEDYIDTKDALVGTDYNTAENDTEKPTSITKDGKKYNLVEVKGIEKGKVVEGTTEVTYVYKKVEKDTPPKDNPIPEKPTPENPKPKLPNTGQTTTNVGVVGLSLIGLALMIRRRER